MSKNTKVISYTFFLSQAVIILLSLIVYRYLSLLHYINISFYISSLFLFTSLIFFSMGSGFFDNVTKSFRLVFAGKGESRSSIEEMRPLSQVVSFNYSPLFIVAMINLAIMCAALFIYYL
ncbi:hypothetical protein SM124_01160 [Bacillus sp. 31A1R]|uniref:DUF3899 domain-containing protein n=1 Tax=Robertmurraya mangrovi TaxID=3098077 RepID=A0ABU5IT98_9BACI|nr:hypothetical protein [Bacillus sp. 31A1R]MDZ5470346.1 hypothetical protein [Bacillus sp. 31A1R]